MHCQFLQLHKKKFSSSLFVSEYQTVGCLVVSCKLDAGQSPMLTRLAAPLAACALLTHTLLTKIGCHGNVASIEKLH